MAKKNFTSSESNDNPVNQFISNMDKNATDEKQDNATSSNIDPVLYEQLKKNADTLGMSVEDFLSKAMSAEMNAEKKSKRVNLVMKPSVFEKCTKKAEKLGLSLNEYMHQLAENDNK